MLYLFKNFDKSIWTSLYYLLIGLKTAVSGANIVDPDL